MRYDVVVVGAGPAGSTASKFLSEQGIKTAIIDKCQFPRRKSCGGGLTAKVLENFRYIDNDRFIDTYCYGGILYSKSLNHLNIRSDRPIIAMVRREKFDHELLKDSIEQGTTHIEKKKINDITIKEDEVRLYGEKGFTISSKYVIGADGVWSKIAERTGLRANNTSFGISLYNEYELPKRTIEKHFLKDHYGHLHLKFNGIPGYGWVFPKKNHLNIGIGIADSALFKNEFSYRLRDVYNDYFNLLKKEKIIPKNLKIGDIKGGTLPHHPLKRTYTDRVLLCGDAAGLINPLTGEGIDYAMYSGKIAANTLINAIEKQRTDRNYLSHYQKSWTHQFGKDIELFYKGSKQWKNDNDRYFSLMKQDKKMSDMFIQITTGNESISKIKWKLIERFIYLRIKNMIH